MGGVQPFMLEVRALTRRYGPLNAIRDLSFEVHPGEVLGLLGPNGSGKSTTVKMLTGLLKPTTGSVYVDGVSVLERLEQYKDVVGYVPEEPHLYTYLTGPEYLQLIGRLRGISDRQLNEKIDAFLQLFDIYDDRFQTLSSYSKGMRQKILLTAAVLHNPRIVILDEPFSGLDVSAARVLKAFVRALASEGKIIVFSSHVLEVVEQVCSRVVILKDGQCVSQGAVAELRSTLSLPSLDAVFAALVSEERVDDRVAGLVSAMKALAADRKTQFRVAWWAFVNQFFTNQSGGSDHQVHQAYVWILVFLLVPGVFMLLQLFPDFQSAVILARLGRVPATIVDDFLAWIALFLTTYSMVAVGLLTVLCWDALTFDRRDALVLGSLPIAATTLLAAKLTALATLLLAVSASIAAINGTMFALLTSDQLGLIVFLKHLFAMFVATFGSGVFVVAAIVMLRAGLVLAGGPGIAAACGPALQFACVVLVLCLIFLSPSVWQVPFMTASRTDWTPPAWFVGVFEWLRSSPRAADPAFPFHMYTQRAVAGTSAVLIAALVFSIGEFHRQMSGVLSPSAIPGWLGRAPVGRWMARLLSGRSAATRAMSDFTLLTLARNRRQQLPIAMHAAVGAAVVIVALASKVTTVGGLLMPRTAILWIPLVMAYWLAAGVRASFFTPSEPSAAWTFKFHPSAGALRCWSAGRASMLGFVVPRVLVICLFLQPALGWRLMVSYTGLVIGVVVAVASLMAGGVAFVPFTRAFEPGHARLRTRWVIYAAGMYIFGYWPARLTAIFVQEGKSLNALIGTVWLTAAAIEIVMRVIQAMPSTTDEPGEDEHAGISVLDLAGARVKEADL